MNDKEWNIKMQEVTRMERGEDRRSELTDLLFAEVISYLAVNGAHGVFDAIEAARHEERLTEMVGMKQISECQEKRYSFGK